MSRTIHGKSTAALKHLRECPAALAVYWCYVARMNNEGVAWPSGRGLQYDTGWSRDSCTSARLLLVKLGALERVDNYIRPEWRKLTARTQRTRVNLDRAEYYRPTGKLVMEGKVYPMLYNGGDEANAIDTDTHEASQSGVSDGLPRRPSTPPTDDAADRRPDLPELDSSIHLDSTTQLDSMNTLAPNGAGTGNTPDKPAGKGKGKTPESTGEAQAIQGIIAAWLATGGANGSKIIEPTAYGNKTKRAEALAMHHEGVTPAVITDYLKAKHADRFWAGRVIEWHRLKGEILGYYAQHRARYGATAAADEVVLPDVMEPLLRGVK